MDTFWKNIELNICSLIDMLYVKSFKSLLFIYILATKRESKIKRYLLSAADKYLILKNIFNKICTLKNVNIIVQSYIRTK